MSRIWGIFAICALTACPIFAQFDTAEVLGTVRDQSGAVVPKAALRLLNVETGIEAKTVADDGGNYTFSNVSIGEYKVTAEANGFATEVATDVTVNVGARQRVDFALNLGAVNQTVEVNDAAAAVETDSSEHGQVIHSAAIVELPLN